MSNDPDIRLSEYLNELSPETTILDLSYWGISEFPDLSRFEKLVSLMITDNHLTTIPYFNKNLIRIDISRNNIIELPEFNDNLEYMYCEHNQLTQLPKFNKNLRKILCGNNKLTSLPKFNEALRECDCSNNKLTELPQLNKCIGYLYCANNQLIKLPKLKHSCLIRLNFSNNNVEYLPELNPSTEIVIGRSNNIKYVHDFNESMYVYHIDLMDNPICEMYYIENPINNSINANNLDIFEIKKINKMNETRRTFHINKYRHQFMRWYWKSQKCKIEEKYRPENLIKLLETMKNMEDEQEFDQILVNW